jgi:hypothetical protein
VVRIENGNIYVSEGGAKLLIATMIGIFILVGFAAKALGA